MKKRIEKLFPVAFDAIEKIFIEKYKLNPIPSEYQGYISSFGASVMQMGLLPTLAVYADAGSGYAQDRSKLLEVFAYVLYNRSYVNSNEKILPLGKNENLFKTVVNKMDENKRQLLKGQLLDVAVAIKLCLRTFKLEEK